MVVVVLMGVLLATVAVTAFPDDRARLATEADRLAQLWTIAHDEAQVRGAPLVWEADRAGFRFYVREGGTLAPVTGDQALRARPWDIAPVDVARLDAPRPEGEARVRVAFARAVADDPFAVELRHGGARALVRSDGLGNFTVELP